MAEPVLSCENLEFSDSGGAIFQGVTFDLSAGQSALVLGHPQIRIRRLMEVCAALRRTRGGDIRWFGQDTSDWTEESARQLHREIGWVHRGSRLVSNMTIRDNITLGLAYHHNLTPKAAFGRVRDLVIRLGLFEIRDRRPADVTWHQQRLACYAREAAKTPKLYLLDNPLADLEQDFDNVFGFLFESVQEGRAAMLVADSKVTNVVDRVDRVIILEENGCTVKDAAEFRDGG